MSSTRTGTRTTRVRTGIAPACAAAGPGRIALTLVEVLMAGSMILIFVPAIIQTAITISRLDRSRETRTHATSLQQIALEGALHRMYDGDGRGFRLSHPAGERRTRYAALPPSYLEYLDTIAAAEDWAISSPDHPDTSQSPVTARFFGRTDPARGYAWPAAGTRPILIFQGVNRASHPELAADLDSYRIEVATAPYAVATDPDLVTKEPGQPRVDLGQVRVTVRWVDPQGRPLDQVLTTRVGRPVHEPDPALSPGGGP